MFDRTRWNASRFFRRVANRIQPWEFLDARQADLGAMGSVDFDAVIHAYRLGRGELFFVQIGANEGDQSDALSQSVRAHGLRGILVEPQAHAFAQLSANYADQPQVILEHAAIAATDGEATMFKARPAFWARHGFPGTASEITSLDRAHIRRHVELFGGTRLAEDEAAYLESETVPALTLTSLLAKHGVARVDLLQIDTEGFDYEILKMIDWSAPGPALIYFESIHLNEADRLAAWALLRENGYTLFAANSYNTVAIQNA